MGLIVDSPGKMESSVQRRMGLLAGPVLETTMNPEQPRSMWEAHGPSPQGQTGSDLCRKTCSVLHVGKWASSQARASGRHSPGACGAPGEAPGHVPPTFGGLDWAYGGFPGQNGKQCAKKDGPVGRTSVGNHYEPGAAPQHVGGTWPEPSQGQTGSDLCRKTCSVLHLGKWASSQARATGRHSPGACGAPGEAPGHVPPTFGGLDGVSIGFVEQARDASATPTAI
jgi:hypothetical protein